MAFEGKAVDTIQLSDVEALVANRVSERKTLDYKELLHLDRESEKKEFLRDVCSFANASGGHLLFGVRQDKNGVPTEICGTDVPNADQEKLRIEQLIRDGIEPRIPGVGTSILELAARKGVVVVHIPRSWARPHRVPYQKDFRFYSRTSNGKYAFDIGEIKAAFLASEALADRIRRFRADRLAAIVAGETPVSLGTGAKTVLHIVPMGAFDPANVLSASALEGQSSQLQPIAGGISGSRYNLDGFVTFDRRSGGSSDDSYAQLFRSGCLEAVDTYLLERPDEVRGYSTNKIIPSIAFESEICQALRRYLAALKNLGVEPPLYVMLSLLEVSGYVMAVSKPFPGDKVPIDRDTLVLPEVLLEDRGAEPARVIRPAFDAIWNACGWPGSINYDDKGNWVERRW
jgi:hypothetical protein